MFNSWRITKTGSREQTLGPVPKHMPRQIGPLWPQLLGGSWITATWQLSSWLRDCTGSGCLRAKASGGWGEVGVAVCGTTWPYQCGRVGLRWVHREECCMRQRCFLGCTLFLAMRTKYYVIIACTVNVQNLKNLVHSRGTYIGSKAGSAVCGNNYGPLGKIGMWLMCMNPWVLLFKICQNISWGQFLEFS